MFSSNQYGTRPGESSITADFMLIHGVRLVAFLIFSDAVMSKSSSVAGQLVLWKRIAAVRQSCISPLHMRHKLAVPPSWTFIVLNRSMIVVDKSRCWN
jgi:ribulose 1,5-bisphosphate synthetase/thiazole synthase